METRSTTDLLRLLDDELARDSGRRDNAAQVGARATELAMHLPWVHRTGHDELNSWLQIFAERRLRPSPVKAHEQADDRISSVYFFLGACAYPYGGVVLLCDPARPLQARATFTPFDSGSLLQHVELTDHPACAELQPWDKVADRTRCLQKYAGRASELAAFASPFLAAHFRDVRNYLTLPRVSDPEIKPPYHGLRSKSGDRRVWTIEVQVHGEVGVGLDEIVEVIVEQDRFDAIVNNGLGHPGLVIAEINADDASSGDALALYCAERILGRVTPALDVGVTP